MNGRRMIPISQLKSDISLTATVEAAGIILRHQGTRAVGLCPFHDEKTPSFYIFDDTRFHCFGCGAHGDVIDFVQKYYGLSFPDAIRHLGINNDRYPKGRFDYEIHKKNALKKRLLSQFKAWREAEIDDLATLVRASHTVLSNIASEADFEKYGFIYDKLSFWEHLLFDILIAGNPDEQLGFYKYSLESKGERI